MTFSTTTLKANDEEFLTYAYRPEGEIKGILMAFHGNSRNAEGACRSAQRLADRHGLAVFAPLFPADTWPSRRYHRANAYPDVSMDDWTEEYPFSLSAAAIYRMGRPDLPVYMFGDSAGGQFLSRATAYHPTYGADPSISRIVIANPSTYVLPDDTIPSPYGFEIRGIDGSVERYMIRKYLAAPVTIYLGTEDTGSEDLAMGEEAMAQGAQRLDRGIRTFEAARAKAIELGCPFRWELRFAVGVGHSAGGMLRAPEASGALGADTPAELTPEAPEPTDYGMWWERIEDALFIDEPRDGQRALKDLAEQAHRLRGAHDRMADLAYDAWSEALPTAGPSTD